MTTETANALRAARARIDSPEKWCKGRAHSDDNEAHCAAGACEGVSHHYLALSKALTGALPADFKPGATWRLSIYNDVPTTTHADIMALFDRAIAAEEEAV